MRTERKSQAEQIHEELKRVEGILEEFHHQFAANQIVKETPETSQKYIQKIMKQFRMLEAYCTEGRRALYRFIHTKNVDKNQFDKMLKGILFKCVNPFFSPDNDLWFEDSRASYVNKTSIDFIEDPSEVIIELIEKLEPIFHNLRNHLEYLSAEIS